MSNIKVIIFDFGNVIGFPPTLQIFNSISNEFNVTYNSIEKAVWKLTPKAQKNQISEKEFWKKLAKMLGIKDEKKLKKI
jgi:hypothetical protein